MKEIIIIKRIIFLSLFFVTSYTQSQTNFIYGKQFGSDKDGFAYNSVSDNYGNVYIAGETKEIIADYDFGETHGFITKFDSLGNTIWTKHIGTEEVDKIQWITIDQLGNLYATGSTKGVLDKKNFGREDIMVIKLDSTGTLQWQKQYGTDSLDIANKIDVDNKMDIYIAGNTTGAMNGKSYGMMDCFILKLDNSGDMIWTKQFGTNRKDECRGIVSDNKSNIYVCGNTAGILSAPYIGKMDGFIGKFTKEGEQLKLLQFGTAEYEIANNLVVDKENQLFVVGWTTGDMGGKQQGKGDSFLSKIDENWEINWTQQFGTNKWDGIHGIALNEEVSENIIVSGCQNWPKCQSFIRMYSKEGSLLSTNNFVANGKVGGTCGQAVNIDNKGNIYHTGGTSGSLFRSFDKGEGHDIFIIKLAIDNSQSNK